MPGSDASHRTPHRSIRDVTVGPPEFVNRFVKPRIWPAGRRVYGHVLELTELRDGGDPWSLRMALRAVRQYHGLTRHTRTTPLGETHLLAVAAAWSLTPYDGDTLCGVIRRAVSRERIYKQRACPEPPVIPPTGRPRALPWDVTIDLGRKWVWLQVAVREVRKDDPEEQVLDALRRICLAGPENPRVLHALEQQRRGQSGIRGRGLPLILLHPHLRPLEVLYAIDPKPKGLPRSDRGRALMILYDRLGAPTASLESFAKLWVHDPPWAACSGPSQYPAFHCASGPTLKVHRYSARKYGEVKGRVLRERYGESIVR